MDAREETEFALFVVKCMNVGDDIQSIAARRFLPKVDRYIDRDRLDLLDNVETRASSIKSIMNGWYLGGYTHWPPKNKKLKPLLTSIHINPNEGDGKALEQFKGEESVAFLKQFSPVGARDKTTLKVLKECGVDAFFSACMTLTLNPVDGVKKKDHILAINVSDSVYESIKQKTKREVVRMDVERTENTTVEENFALAQYYLYMYQSAHCVITTRLHATLPTIAVDGRVLFIIESNGDNTDFKERFDGLYQLARHMTAEEFIKDMGPTEYDIDNPPDNPTEYKKYRSELEKSCKKYTGHDSRQDYMFGMSIEDLITSPVFFSAITKIAEESWDAYKYEHRISIPAVVLGDVLESKRLERVLYQERNPGIITATKRLIKAILYKLNILHRIQK